MRGIDSSSEAVDFSDDESLPLILRVHQSVVPFQIHDFQDMSLFRSMILENNDLCFVNLLFCHRQLLIHKGELVMQKAPQSGCYSQRRESAYHFSPLSRSFKSAAVLPTQSLHSPRSLAFPSDAESATIRMLLPTARKCIPLLRNTNNSNTFHVENIIWF